MRPPRRTALCVLSTAVLFLPAAAQNASIRRVQVLRSKGAVEIEIEGSDRLAPQTQVLTGPDRVVMDFPNATPSAQVRSQSVDRGEVKDVRVGLFQSNPPVTRVVLDLKSPQSYQVFPYGRTVMIKLTAAPQEADGVDYFAPVTRPGLVNTSFSTSHGATSHIATGSLATSSVATSNVPTPRAALQTGPATKRTLDVSFSNGLLSIRANKANLSEVLFAVRQRTGAEIALVAGAEQEQVVADIGPAPAPEVLARLLNGSRFNFLILSSATDPHVLEHVILSPRGEGTLTPTPPVNTGIEQASEEADDDAPPPPPPIPARAPTERPRPEVRRFQPGLEPPDRIPPEEIGPQDGNPPPE